MLTEYGRKIIKDARTQILLKNIPVNLFAYCGIVDPNVISDGLAITDLKNKNCQTCADGALLLATCLDDPSLSINEMQSIGILDKLSKHIDPSTLAYIEMAAMTWGYKYMRMQQRDWWFGVAARLCDKTLWTSADYDHARNQCLLWANAMCYYHNGSDQVVITVNVYNNVLRNGYFNPADMRFSRPRDFHRFTPKVVTPCPVLMQDIPKLTEMVTPATFVAGQRYTNGSSTYIVGRVGPHDYCLINLETGNRFTKRVTIEDDNKMLLSTLVGGSTDGWKLVAA